MFLRIRKEGNVVLWHVATLALDLCCEPARIILHFCHLKHTCTCYSYYINMQPFYYFVKSNTSKRVNPNIYTLTLMMSPFWKLSSSASDAVKEKRATASMLYRRVRGSYQNSFTIMNEEREYSCVIRAQRCDDTLLQDEIISVCVCVPLFLHVTELKSVWTRGVDECPLHFHLWFLHTLKLSGALKKHFHKGNQWQWKEGKRHRKKDKNNPE